MSVLNSEALDIINDKHQCLAMVGNHYCKNKVVTKDGCFCSQKHSHLEIGESRAKTYEQMYQLKVIDDDVKELESLVSSESFQKHRQLAALIPPELRRYRSLLARNGELHPSVRKLKPVATSIEKYINLFKRLNTRMIALQDVLDGPKTYSAYSSPLSSPSHSAPQTPVAMGPPVTAHPVPPVTAHPMPPVASSSMDIDGVPRAQHAKRTAQAPLQGNVPAKRPRIPAFEKRANLDKEELKEDSTADDIDTDEEYSDIEYPNADDLTFSDYADGVRRASPGLSDALDGLQQ